ncbi:MAG: hypothetical protein A3F83_12950 [Candidatus Glassbacteria bacterium RIFCSPLOWO2_12_FULL_58_11]|uniref:Uncharacterized protein n=1 Tax=Candidatus Glassbacteria bacterium RIFCSPLOWO2_12_FULL_58_11 TaxID=1817867 RepID=A0A1F5YWW9_9BACT|nr:MAG: hypothetical protein A3F83_12950 [Candidatus Glassbacteria bacterium RIFCSPLOWO2_12_FULL_58_11]
MGIDIGDQVALTVRRAVPVHPVFPINLAILAHHDIVQAVPVDIAYLPVPENRVQNHVIESYHGALSRYSTPGLRIQLRRGAAAKEKERRQN